MISMACIFNIIFISKLVEVEMAFHLGIQNEIQAVCSRLQRGKSRQIDETHLNKIGQPTCLVSYAKIGG